MVDFVIGFIFLFNDFVVVVIGRIGGNLGKIIKGGVGGLMDLFSVIIGVIGFNFSVGFGFSVFIDLIGF